MKRWPGENLFAALFHQFLFAVPAGAVLAQLLFPGTVPSPDQLMAVAPMALVGSVLFLLPGIMAIFWASRVLFPGRAAILMMSEALVATVSATIVLLACLLGS